MGIIGIATGLGFRVRAVEFRTQGGGVCQGRSDSTIPFVGVRCRPE